MNNDEQKQPTIYLLAGPDNSVSISAYSCDDPKYESSHWDVLDYRTPHVMSQDALMGCLRNVLALSGAKIIME